VQDYLGEVAAGRAGIDPNAVRMSQSKIPSEANTGARMLDQQQRDQRRQAAMDATEANRQAKEAERLAEEERKRQVRIGVSEGRAKTTDVQTGKTTLDTLPTGAPAFQTGEVGKPRVLPAVQQDKAKVIAGVPGFGELMVNDQIVQKTPYEPSQGKALVQDYRNPEGQTKSQALPTHTDPKTGQVTVSTKDAWGAPQKVDAGVDEALAAKVAKDAELEQRKAALDLRLNNINQTRMQFNPRWKGPDGAKTTFDKAAEALNNFEEKPIFARAQDREDTPGAIMKWAKVNPKTGQAERYQKDVIARVDPLSGESNITQDEDGNLVRVTSHKAGDLVEYDPLELVKWRKDRAQLQAAHDRAKAEHDRLLPQAERLNAAKFEVKDQHLKLAAEKIQHEHGMPPEAAGAAETLAAAETGVQSPWMRAWNEATAPVPGVIAADSTKPAQNTPEIAKNQPEIAQNGQKLQQPPSAGGAGSAAPPSVQPSAATTPAPPAAKVFPTNHPNVKNDDGSTSNVILAGVNINGKERVIPTMVDGKKLSVKEATTIAIKNGIDKYPTFNTPEEGDAWAKANHGNIDEQGNLKTAAAPATAKKPLIPLDDPGKIAMFSKAAGGLDKPEEISVETSPQGITWLTRKTKNGATDNIGSVAKDARGNPYVMLSSSLEGRGLQKHVDYSATDGMPIYLREPDGSQPIDPVKGAQYVADVFKAVQDTIPAGQDAVWAKLQEMKATPDQIAMQVYHGKLSVQDGQSLIKGVYPDLTLKADDPLAPATFGKWLSKQDAETKDAWNKAKEPEEKDAVKSKFLEDWWSNNGWKPGVDVGTLEEAIKVVTPGRQAEGTIRTIARKFDMEIAPAIGTLVGGFIGALVGAAAGIETGPGAVVTSVGGAIAGGTATGVVVAEMQKRILTAIMGEKWVKTNELQMAANARKHGEADMVATMAPLFISCMGGNVGVPVRNVGGGFISKAITGAGKAATEEAAFYNMGAVARGLPQQAMKIPMVERIAQNAAIGMRVDASRAAQEKYVGGKTNEDGSEISVINSALRGGVSFAALGFMPESIVMVPTAKQVLERAVVHGVSNAAVMTMAGTMYDSLTTGKLPDWNKVAKETGGTIPPFVVQSLVMGVLHRSWSGRSDKTGTVDPNSPAPTGTGTTTPPTKGPQSGFRNVTPKAPKPTVPQEPLTAEQAVIIETNPAKVAEMHPNDYAKWLSHNVTLEPGDQVASTEALANVQTAITAARTRGDTATEQVLTAQIHASTQRTDWTAEELGSDDPEFIERINNDARDFNQSLADTRTRLGIPEAPQVQAPTPNQPASAPPTVGTMVEYSRSDGRVEQGKLVKLADEQSGYMIERADGSTVEIPANREIRTPQSNGQNIQGPAGAQTPAQAAQNPPAAPTTGELGGPSGEGSGTKPAPPGEPPVTAGKHDDLPAGTIVRSDVYHGEGDITLTGPAQQGPNGPEYPAYFSGTQRYGMVQARHITNIATTPAKSTGTTPDAVQSPKNGEAQPSTASTETSTTNPEAKPTEPAQPPRRVAFHHPGLGGQATGEVIETRPDGRLRIKADDHKNVIVTLKPSDVIDIESTPSAAIKAPQETTPTPTDNGPTESKASAAQSPDQTGQPVRKTAPDEGQNANGEKGQVLTPSEPAAGETSTSAATKGRTSPRQIEAFDQGNVPADGREPVRVNEVDANGDPMFKVGEKVIVDGEEMTVSKVQMSKDSLGNEDVDYVVLNDGSKFGRQVLKSGDTVWTETDDSPTPKEETKAQAVEQAASETNTEPTEAQKEAGNYAKGKVTLHGMTVSIENPKGSTRSGTDKNGKPWSVEMKSHYGYFLGSEGRDKQHVDVFIGPNPDGKKAFVVNQIDPATGRFDEHKVMLAYDSRQEAIAGYQDNYKPGWKGLGSIVETDVDTLREWLKTEDTKKPAKKEDFKPTVKESLTVQPPTPGTPEFKALPQAEKQAAVKAFAESKKAERENARPERLTPADFQKTAEFVHEKGKRMLMVRIGNAMHTINDQRNGQLTKPAGEVLADLHKALIQQSVDLLKADLADASPQSVASTKNLAKTRLKDGGMYSVSADAVDAYDIKLPDGYVRKGDLYVREAAKENPPAPAPATTLEEVTAASAHLPEGVFQDVIDGMDREIERARTKVENLQKINERLNEQSSKVPGSFVTGRSNQHKGLMKQRGALNDRMSKAFTLWQDAEKHLRELEEKRAGYVSGERHENGQPRANSPSRQAATSAVGSYGDYLRATVKKGDRVTFVANPDAGGSIVKSVNKKTITLEGGSSWSFDYFMPWKDGREMTKAELKEDIKAWRDKQPPSDSTVQEPGAPFGDALGKEKERLFATAPRGNDRHPLAPNGQRSNLAEDQWSAARTDGFKKDFGDWETLDVQRRLDLMSPTKITVPDSWRGKSIEEMRQSMAEILDEMVRNKAVIEHPEIGTIHIGRRGAGKTENTSADPAKILIASDLENTIPRSIKSGFSKSKEQGVEGYTTLLLPVNVDGHELTAIFTIRKQSDGQWYYNTVAVADKEMRPGSYESPGALARPLGKTPITGLDGFIRRELKRVNPESFQGKLDSNGEPLPAEVDRWLVKQKDAAPDRVEESQVPLDASEVSTYLAANGTPASVIKAESERVSQALEQHRSGGLAEDGKPYSQGDFFAQPESAPSPKGGATQVPAASPGTKPKTGTKLPSVSEDLYAGLTGDWQALAREVNDKGRAVQILPQLIKHEIPYWNPVGTRIESPADVHALMIPIRSPFFESVKVMILDGQNNIVAARIITIGSVNESVASTGEIMGELARLREETGKKYQSIILSHNHPSGDPSPSSHDDIITRRLREAADMTGWEVLDHIITNGETYHSYRESGMMYSSTVNEEKPFTPRRMGPLPDKNFPMKADWEVALPSKLQSMDQPEKIAELAKFLRNGNPDAAHLLMMNTRMNLLGIERMTSEQAMDSQYLAQRIANARGSFGAYAVAIDLPAGITGDNSKMHLLAMRVQAIKDSMGVRVVDISSVDPEGPGYYSAMEEGVLREPARDFGKDENQPDLFAATRAPDATQRLGSVKVGTMSALGAYRTLTAKRDAGKALTADEHQKLLDAEQALGQKLAFDMDAVKGQEQPAALPGGEQSARPAPVKSPREVQQGMGFGNEVAKSGQMSLFEGEKPFGKHPADVWKDFPHVQWMVRFNHVSNIGGPRITVPDAKYGTRSFNADWYFAKGRGEARPEEREKSARQLINRIVNATPRGNLDSMRDFIKANPDAILVPVRGLEEPNTASNIIPERFARFLSIFGGNPVNETVHKTNTSHNTGKDAKSRLFTVHEFDGAIEPGKDYIIVDDVSTTGATAYYLARHIASQGGRVVGDIQMGLTPRGEMDARKQRAFVGDEHIMAMSDATKKSLQAKGDDATLNAVVQQHGIAYDWHTLTDALGRALNANWSTASRAAGMPGVGTQVRGGTQSGRPVDYGRAGEVPRRLPAFPGEREAAGLDRPAPGETRITPPAEGDGQMRLLEPETPFGANRKGITEHLVLPIPENKERPASLSEDRNPHSLADLQEFVHEPAVPFGASKDAIKQALAKLPPVYRGVFEAVQSGLSTPEVMERFKVNEKAVGNIVSQVHARIAAATGEPAPAESQAPPASTPPPTTTPKAQPVETPKTATVEAPPKQTDKEMVDRAYSGLPALMRSKIPGLDIVGDITHGIKSLLLPTSNGPGELHAAELLGRRIGEMHRRQESVNGQFEKSWKTFEKLGVHREGLPIDENQGIKFMSDRSSGRPMSPEMQAINDMADKQDAMRVKLLEEAGVPLQTVRQDYFPGIWTKESRRAFNMAMDEANEAGIIPAGTGVNEATPEQKAWVKARVDELLDLRQGSDATPGNDWLAMIAKRPFPGGESFKKSKVFDQDIKTAFEFGLRPTSYNPVDQMKLKWAEMDRSIMAHQYLRDLSREGLVKVLDPFAAIPEGWQEIQDNKVGKIYGSPTITVPEYVNKAVYDGLMKVAENIGITPQRVFNAGRGKLGYASRSGETVTQFATDLGVLAHEIGHQLDFKYDLWDRIVTQAEAVGKRGEVTKTASDARRAQINRELRALADLKLESETPTDYRQRYVRKKVEKMAHMLEAYIKSRELFRAVAPDVFSQFESFIRSTPEIAELENVKPRMTYEELTSDKYLGLVQTGKRIVPNAVGDILNNYLSESLYNNRYFGKLYTGWMALANKLNQAQLGVGSAFHAGFTTLEAQISANATVMKDMFGILRGNRGFTDLGKSIGKAAIATGETYYTGNKVLNAWRDPDGVIDPKIAQVVRAIELAGGGFTMERGLKSDDMAAVYSDWNNGHKVMAMVKSPLAAVEAMAYPIMTGLVPRQKAGVFAHMANRIIEQNPGKALEDLAPEFRQAWNRVDARLGQVRYDRLFIRNTAKNFIQMLVRAPGWTGGTIAEIGGAFKDTYKFFEEWTKTGKLPQDIPDRVAYTTSLVLTTALINALLTYLFTGDKPKDMDPSNLDYWAFRTGGTDEHGNPERFVLPTYMKDMLAWSKEPGTTALNKTHPLISLAADMVRNKDYYGIEVSNKDDELAKRIMDDGKYIAKAFVPFWMRGAQREREREAPPYRQALPMIGVMPAPAKMTETDAERAAAEYSKDTIPVGARTQAQADASKAKYEIVKKLKAKEPVDWNAELKAGHIKPKDFTGLLRRSQMNHLQYVVKKLSIDKAEAVFKKANPDEKKQLEQIMLVKRFHAHTQTPEPEE